MHPWGPMCIPVFSGRRVLHPIRSTVSVCFLAEAGAFLSRVPRCTQRRRSGVGTYPGSPKAPKWGHPSGGHGGLSPLVAGGLGGLNPLVAGGLSPQVAGGSEPPSGRGSEPPSGRGSEPPSGWGSEPPCGRGPEPPSDKDNGQVGLSPPMGQAGPRGPKGPKWDNPSIKRGSVFGPGCLEAPKDGEKGYPGVPKGPEWENPS